MQNKPQKLVLLGSSLSALSFLAGLIYPQNSYILHVLSCLFACAFNWAFAALFILALLFMALVGIIAMFLSNKICVLLLAYTVICILTAKRSLQ